jgi:hypothetical protein
MARLITFGCSVPFGQGLSDCLNTSLLDIHKLTPSQYGWPALLGSQLGIPVINKSWPAASNMEILYNILEFEYQENDIVVIMWANYLRDVYITSLFKFPFFRRRLGVWKNTALARKWIDNMSEQDYIKKSWIYIHHAGLHLRNKNVKYIHYPAYPLELDKHRLTFLDIEHYYSDGAVYEDFALDGSHPGPKSHKIMADKIFNRLNEHK